MDKRQLNKIPKAEATKKVSELAKLGVMADFIYTTELVDEILIMNFFRARTESLAYRLFMVKGDYLTQDFTGEKMKWRTGGIDSIILGGYVPATVRDRKRAYKFILGCGKFEQDFEEGRLNRLIEVYQGQIRFERNKAKEIEVSKKIDEQMKLFKGIPKDYDKFVIERVFWDYNFIFYNRKEQTAYCTRCKKDVGISSKGMIGKYRAKHNEEIQCPVCKKVVMLKSEGMSRSQLSAIQWSVLIQGSGENVLVRYFRHVADFRGDYKNPKYSKAELVRSIHCREKMTDYYYSWAKYQRESRWNYYKEQKTGYFGPSEFVWPRKAVLYNGFGRSSLEKSLKGTWLQYGAAELFISKIAEGYVLKNAFDLEWYFNSYRKHPYEEKLLKAGLAYMVGDIMNYNDWHGSYEELFDTEQTELVKILRIDKNRFRILRDLEKPGILALKILQYREDIKESEFRIVYGRCKGRYDGGNYKNWLDMKNYTTIYKVDMYVNRQCKGDALSYFDYIHWLERLGYDTSNEFCIYPKNFKSAHDRVSREYQELLDQEKKKEKELFNKMLKEARKKAKNVDAMNLQMCGLFIRLPYTIDELKVEGTQLHHCVGTYADKVMKGITRIFFIRKIEEPEKPYYTLEYKDGHVIQCRGLHNKSAEGDVKLFAELFSEKMKKYEKKKVG